MPDLEPLPGKFVWFELATKDAKKAQAFYSELFGWKTQSVPMGTYAYDMICLTDSLDSMIGGYRPKDDARPSYWISYVSVENVDAAAQTAASNGGRVVEKPYDIPTVGRVARIADAQGAELCVFKSVNGDPPDGIAPNGGWVWNELHTTDPANALAFYGKVVGYTHQSMDMGPGGTYHILSKSGADRGGVTAHLPKGAPPHWLPYISVADVDATIARARKLGAAIPMEPESIPGVGRVGFFVDPTGAQLAVIKPMPRAPK
jgi:predicted enzyme related to lactoylglutathione lyase